MTKNNSKIICLIPARYGSKGVSQKNIKLIKDKPLIAHAIQKAKKSKVFSKIIVSTDHKKIQKIAEDFGAEVPFLRPKKLAGDNSSMNDVVIHAIKNLEDLDYSFEQIFIYDITTFFLEPKDIIGMVKLFKKSKPNTVILSYKTHLNPYFNQMELNSNGFLQISKKFKTNIVSRKSAPIVFQLAGCFLIDKKNFLKYKKLHMPKEIPYVVSQKKGLMIDTEFEFEIASKL
tara:strand:+ start:351 stop:1040 length:690 start_codon:yes stop_codon:yes gene_type:complete